MFAGTVIAVVTWRTAVLIEGGAPAGIDGGNWLAFGRDLFGADIRPGSVSYPPLVPLAFATAVASLGATWGTAVLTALTSVAPACAVFAVLWRRAHHWGVVALPGLLLLIAPIGALSSWGGLPQLAGGALTIGALAVLDRSLATCSTRLAVLAGALLAAVAATSHLSALWAVSGAAALAGYRLAIGGRGPLTRRLRVTALAAGSAVLLALPLLPVYLALGSAMRDTLGTHLALTGIDWSDPARTLDVVFGRARLAALALALLGAGCTVVLLVRARAAAALPLALAVGLGAAVALTSSPRPLYEVPVVATLAIGCLLTEDSAEPVARGALATGAGLLLVMAAAGVDSFRDQRTAYGVLTPDVRRAIEVADEATGDTALLVSAAGDAPLGWWVEGLTGERAVYGSALRWLLFPDERERATLANEVFLDGRFPADPGVDSACEEGLTVVLVRKEPPVWPPRAVSSRARIIHDGEDAAVYELDCSSP